MKKLINLLSLQLGVLLLVTSCKGVHSLNWGGVKDYSLDDLKSKDIKTILEEEGFEGRELRRTARKDTRTLLCWAAENGATPIVMKLLEESVNEKNINNMEDNDGNGAMILAIQNGHLEIVELLVNKGMNIERSFHRGKRAIHYAAEAGYDEIVELLIDKGAQIDSPSGDGDYTALMWAASKGHMKVVELLVEEKADITNALEEGVYGGNVEVVKYLLENNAPVDISRLSPCVDGNSHVEAANLVFDTLDDGQKNELIYEAIKYDHRETVRLLIEGNYIDPNVIIEQGGDRGIKETPLVYATRVGNLEIVKLLLQDERVDPNMLCGHENSYDYKMTPLMMAAHQGHADILRCLILDDRVDINVVTYFDGKPHTALIIALAENKFEIERLLRAAALRDADRAAAKKKATKKKKKWF